MGREAGVALSSGVTVRKMQATGVGGVFRAGQPLSSRPLNKQGLVLLWH